MPDCCFEGFAISNFLGPLVLGRLFDTWGRRQMIAATYAVSGLLLGVTAMDLLAPWPIKIILDHLLLAQPLPVRPSQSRMCG